MTSIVKIRANCDLDCKTGCWLWKGGTSRSGPVVWSFDERHGKKVSMSGPRALWQILNGQQVPAGKMAYRTCFVHLCLAPSHVAAGTHAEVGRMLRLVGKRIGTSTPQRNANAAKARAALGIVDTSAAVVLELRALPASVSHAEGGRRFNLSRDVVSQIRRGLRRADVWKEAA